MEIKLCISVNIYCRLPKLGMSTHVFKISLCYDKKWEIKIVMYLSIPFNMAAHMEATPTREGI